MQTNKKRYYFFTVRSGITQFILRCKEDVLTVKPFYNLVLWQIYFLVYRTRFIIAMSDVGVLEEDDCFCTVGSYVDASMRIASVENVEKLHQALVHHDSVHVLFAKVNAYCHMLLRLYVA